jgi:hypothetical protein
MNCFAGGCGHGTNAGGRRGGGACWSMALTAPDSGQAIQSAFVALQEPIAGAVPAFFAAGATAQATTANTPNWIAGG